MSYSPTPFKEGNGKDTERERGDEKKKGEEKEN